MEELKEKASDLLEHVEDIAETYYKLAVVNVTEKASNIAATTIVAVLSVILSFLILIFLGLGLSWWLGDLVGSRVGGFLLGAAFFVLLLVIILAMRKTSIFPKVRNSIIRSVYEQQD